MQDPVFDELSLVFQKEGHALYIVGGTSRDLLLGRSFTDRDYCTDATPEEMKAFLPKANYSFARYGSVRLYKDKQEVDITSLREEGKYLDCRHPSYVKFVKDLKKDYKRRDFTINAIYIDKDYKAIDYCGGLIDLDKRLIRFIGDPIKRVKEDPLRILRAYRFAKVLGFELEEKTRLACLEGEPMLTKLNPDKVMEEKKKLEKALGETK